MIPPYLFLWLGSRTRRKEIKVVIVFDIEAKNKKPVWGVTLKSTGNREDTIWALRWALMGSLEEVDIIDSGRGD